MVDAALTSSAGDLLDRLFQPGEIGRVRHQVAGLAREAGLTGDRLDGFVLAVNEIVTNVILHAGGEGRIRLRVADGAVYCTVLDAGAGIPAEQISPDQPPDVLDVGGRGIWLAHQLCDTVTIASGPTGTSIELSSGLPQPAQPL